MVAPSNPSPPLLGMATGEVVGSHFYIYNQPPLGSSDPGSLWRWRPAMAPPPAASGGCSAAIAAGHTAGIVIGILIGLGNLYILFALAGNAGASLLPEWAGRLPVVGAYLSAAGGGRAAAPGFYTASASAVNTAGGYAAPPDM